MSSTSDSVSFRRGRRTNVFCEAATVDPNWTPPKHYKTDQERSQISKILIENPLFKSYDSKIRNTLIEAVEKKVFTKDQVIISQGAEGDYYYLIESGICEVFKYYPDLKLEKKVFTCYENYGFGELALLHDAPRAATVIAKSDTVVCWVIDRNTFKRLIRDVTTNTRSMYEKFLESVPILKSLDNYERQLLADSLEVEEFDANEVIIKEGDSINNKNSNDKMYIVEEGEVKCTMKVDDKEKEVCKRLTKGCYFGELALLLNKPRAATVTTTKPTAVVSIGRRVFKNVLGPLKDILGRNADTYLKYDELIKSSPFDKQEDSDDDDENDN